MVKGYDIDQYDESALTGRSMAEIAGDQGSAEWTSSRPASRGEVKAPWLADAMAKLDKEEEENRHRGHGEKPELKKNEKDDIVTASARPATVRDAPAGKSSSVPRSPQKLRL